LKKRHYSFRKLEKIYVDFAQRRGWNAHPVQTRSVVEAWLETRTGSLGDAIAEWESREVELPVFRRPLTLLVTTCVVVAAGVTQQLAGWFR
jgi:hypothetical protein